MFYEMLGENVVKSAVFEGKVLADVEVNIGVGRLGMLEITIEPTF